MFFEIGVPRILSLIFVTANGIPSVLVLPWIEVCNVRSTLNNIGTSALLATVKALKSVFEGLYSENFRKWSAKILNLESKKWCLQGITRYIGLQTKVLY